MNTFNFKIINHDSAEYKAAVKLREEILRKPLGLSFLPEELEVEKDYIQIAGFHGDEIISTAVLVPEDKNYKMQRVVVKKSLQGSGVGSKMMEFCEDYAKRTQDIRSIYCHARASAVNFYLNNGYIPEGDYFDEDTIPHLKMRKKL